MSELRWNALLGQWVVTATHRQGRTFLPLAATCPLCPTRSKQYRTEVPASDFDIVVLENRFPSLRLPPPQPAIESHGVFKAAPARGICEVVLYTSRHDLTFAQLDHARVEHLVQVWIDRTRALQAHPEIQYVFIFENKGESVGVTLHHPHGQIYAYPFVPPIIANEIEQMRSYRSRTDRCLLCDLVHQELDDGTRIVHANEAFIAFIPFAARWPYEVHVVAKCHYGALTSLERLDIQALAHILLYVTRGYDALFSRSMPYIMALHQAPKQNNDDAFHLHIEFYPPMRSEDRLKYLAGSELGAGMFINDTLPEESAMTLRDASARQ